MVSQTDALLIYKEQTLLFDRPDLTFFIFFITRYIRYYLYELH